MLNLKEYLKKSWFFKKYEITDDTPFLEMVWKYQWNHKALIMIECGILIIVLNLIFG